MNETEFISGLMRQSYNEVGFIPDTTLQARYLRLGRYAIQHNTHGVPVGYILHGSAKPGGLLSITQTLIEYDLRQNGHGMDAIVEVIRRAKDANCRAIKATVADDLMCHGFWLAAGFKPVHVLGADNTRHRTKTIYIYDLWPTLFGGSTP